jgi:endonuclease G
LDPAWGAQAIALLGNEDTFHFTNCSPQYWGFNQGSELWAGLENYILYNTDKENVRATVFTGPGFQKNDEEHRDVLIPQCFWKVVVVDSTDGTLYSSAYTVDQSQWSQNIPFRELPVGKYQHYQVPVLKIQTSTGLQFSTGVLDADVLKGKPEKHLRGLSDIEHPKR